MGILRAGLTNESYDRDYSNRELVTRIAAYFRPWWPRLVLIITMVSLLALMGAAVPILVVTRRGIDG